MHGKYNAIYDVSCVTLLVWACVGCSIVNEEKKIVGIGYNGFPNGCNDDELPWARTADSPLETKYPVSTFTLIPE